VGLLGVLEQASQPRDKEMRLGLWNHSSIDVNVPT